MGRTTLQTDRAPASALYAQGTRKGPFVFVSGTVGLDPATGELAGPSIQEQTRQAVANCAAILDSGGATLDDVVEVGILLADPDDFAGMNEAWSELFPSDPPARYAAKLGAVIPGVLVSIRMTAVTG